MINCMANAPPRFPVSILLSVFSKFYLFQFWTFGEIEHDRQKAWERDSRPMANYGLVLRCSDLVQLMGHLTINICVLVRHGQTLTIC